MFPSAALLTELPRLPDYGWHCPRNGESSYGFFRSRPGAAPTEPPGCGRRRALNRGWHCPRNGESSYGFFRSRPGAAPTEPRGCGRRRALNRGWHCPRNGESSYGFFRSRPGAAPTGYPGRGLGPLLQVIPVAAWGRSYRLSRSRPGAAPAGYPGRGPGPLLQVVPVAAGIARETLVPCCAKTVLWRHFSRLLRSKNVGMRGTYMFCTQVACNVCTYMYTYC